MAGSPWWWMGDGGVWCWTSSSMSVVDSIFFFFLRWITSFLLKLLSNCWIVEVYLQIGGISTGGASLAAATTLVDCSPFGRLDLWAPNFSRLLVRDWVGGGGTCGVGFTFFTWGVGVSSKRGATFLYVSWTPSHLYHHQSHWAHVIILQWTMVVAS